jgi:Lrp/AsnC family leucine-responsive transcriptional regulator
MEFHDMKQINWTVSTDPSFRPVTRRTTLHGRTCRKGRSFQDAGAGAREAAEAEGYIRGYAAIIDREKMGQGHIAFVQVKLSDTRSAALDAFNRAVVGVAEVEQCHMMAASFDYLLKVRTTDIAAYRKVLGEKISALPHVAQTSTFVVMETVKDR